MLLMILRHKNYSLISCFESSVARTYGKVWSNLLCTPRQDPFSHLDTAVDSANSGRQSKTHLKQKWLAREKNPPLALKKTAKNELSILANSRRTKKLK